MDRQFLINNFYPSRIGKKIDCLNDCVEETKKVANTDMMPRTIRGIGPLRKAHPDFDKTAIENMAETIWNFLNGPVLNQSDFDDWHKKTSEKFLRDFNDSLKNLKATYRGNTIQIKYGKAQKVLNMTLKDLYCRDGGDRFQNHFKYCHVALDTFTYGSGDYNGWYKDKIGKYRGVWSNLCYADYFEIQKDIRGYLNSNSNCLVTQTIQKGLALTTQLSPIPFSPFQAEFLAWVIYK